MIYLKLFLTFFEIGLFTFGGGYAMISLIRDRAVTLGWLAEEELLNMIAVSESTPGPIAVNMATFVGSTQGGILGSLAATLGVVLPSFIIILLIASILKNPVVVPSKSIRPVIRFPQHVVKAIGIVLYVVVSREVSQVIQEFVLSIIALFWALSIFLMFSNIVLQIFS
jgi:chromate transport protein ChrA